MAASENPVEQKATESFHLCHATITGNATYPGSIVIHNETTTGNIAS